MEDEVSKLHTKFCKLHPLPTGMYLEALSMFCVSVFVTSVDTLEFWELAGKCKTESHDSLLKVVPKTLYLNQSIYRLGFDIKLCKMKSKSGSIN